MVKIALFAGFLAQCRVKALHCAATDQVKDAVAALEAKGYEVQEHKFEVTNSTAFGANPGNPYVVYDMPASAFQIFNERDAVLFVGCTPSKTRYFSWRSYLMLDPSLVFASLGDSLNNMVINTTTGSAFDSTAAVVTTSDSTTFHDVHEALVASGLGAGVNLDAYDASLIQNRDKSRFVMLHRASVWEDDKARKEYFAQIRPVYYLKAPAGAEAPLPRLPIRTPGTGRAEQDDEALMSAFSTLETGVTSWASGSGMQQVSSIKLADYTLDGYDCIEQGKDCLGDNRDTNYIKSDAFKLVEGQVAIFFGSNSQATGKCTYTNFGIYTQNSNREGAVPTATSLTVDDRSFNGSALYFAPHLDQQVASKLFAVAVARDCGSLPFCLEASEKITPLNKWLMVVYRTYLEPETKTGPLVSELILPKSKIYGAAISV